MSEDSNVRKKSSVSRPPSRASSYSRPVSRAGSISGRNSVSGSPAPNRRSFSGGGGYDTVPRSRASSSGRSSRSPDREYQQQNGGVVYSGGMPYTRKSSNGNVQYPAAPKKSGQRYAVQHVLTFREFQFYILRSNTGIKMYTNMGLFSTMFSWQNSLRDLSSPTPSRMGGKRRSRSSFSRDARESSFDENEEYAYAENNRSMSTSSRQQVRLIGNDLHWDNCVKLLQNYSNQNYFINIFFHFSENKYFKHVKWIQQL